jgi:hypothetical protein
VPAVTRAAWPAGAGLATFLACVIRIPAGPHWLDCGELVAAATGLGLPHPPGHPVVVVLGKAAELLIPLGPAPFRVALASALALALAVWLLCKLGEELLAGPMGAPAKLAGPLAAACALAAGWSSSALIQGVRAEVYAANALLTLGALAALAGHPTPRRLALAGLCAGLGLANHHYLVILALAGPALVAACMRPRPGAPGVAAAGAGVALGLASYALLPVRALADTVSFWGDPRTLGNLAWTVSAKAFQKSLAPAVAPDVWANLADALFVLMDALTPVGALVGLVGLGVAVRRAPRTGLILAMGVPGVFLSKALMGFDPHNPDLHGYFLPAALLLALGYAALGGFLLKGAVRLPRRPRLGLIGLTGVAVVAFAVSTRATSADSVPRPGFGATRLAATALLEQIPPHGVALTADFNNTFALWSHRQVAGARPDVALISRPFLAFPGYTEHVTRAEPDLGAIARHPWSKALDRGDCLPSPIAGRPLLLAPFHDLSPRCLRQLRATGILARRASAAAPSAEALWASLERRMLSEGPDPQTHRWLLWNHWLHARQRMASGDLPSAWWHVRAGLRIAPASPELVALRASLAAPDQ